MPTQIKFESVLVSLCRVFLASISGGRMAYYETAISPVPECLLPMEHSRSVQSQIPRQQIARTLRCRLPPTAGVPLSVLP